MPLSDEAHDAITEILGDYISDKKSFTAYTITTEARKQGVVEPHHEIKKLVHEVWRFEGMDGYNRSSVELSTGRAYLYHPEDIEPDEAVNFMVKQDSMSTKPKGHCKDCQYGSSILSNYPDKLLCTSDNSNKGHVELNDSCSYFVEDTEPTPDDDSDLIG